MPRSTPETGAGLHVLGLSRIEAAAYRRLLRQPGLTGAGLAALLGLPAAKVQAAVQRLVRRGFVTLDGEAPDRRLHPAPPDIAIEALLLERQRALLQARSEIEALRREQSTAAGRGPIVEIIAADPAAQVSPYALCHRVAVHEVLCLIRPPFRVSSPRRTEDVRAAARERGVRYRNIVHPDTLGLPGWTERLRHEAEAGEEYRLLSDFPFKMIVADRAMALLPLTIDDPAGPMLLLRASAVLDALCELFEHLWAIAAPIDAAGLAQGGAASPAAAAPGGGIDPLVALLAAGANDKTVADRLGISERTLMRRIDAMYRRLGARSRFHAGWLAAMRAAAAQSDRDGGVLP